MLQGDNVAGGIGVDKEFIESILVPQVMLYGFLGFTPDVDGFRINPKLPDEWPSLTITRILFHDQVLSIKVTQNNEVMIYGSGPPEVNLNVEVPGDFTVSAQGVTVEVKKLSE